MAKAAIVGAGVFVCVVLYFAGPSWPIVTQRLGTDGPVALAWMLAAWGLGWPIVAWQFGTGDEPPSLSIATASAVGLGVMSLIVLGLGLTGWLNYYTSWTIIGVGLALAVGKIWAHGAQLEEWLQQPAGAAWLWVVAMLPAGMIAVAALLPPGILWGDEPNGYDVVEYHLQVPREWFEARRIMPLNENVFSYFPQGVEMHFLLAMELRGGPWEGMYLAQFMHAGMCALAAVALGPVAGLLVALTPWTALLAPIAYVEGGVLLYGALAIAWAMRSIGGRRLRETMLAGAMAGFACGVKLTDVPMLLAAIPLALLCVDRTNWLRKSAMFWAVGMVAFVPWLLRTAAWAGNPIFPEAMSLLGHAHFSAIQVERWRRAYLPVTGRWTGLWEQVIADWRYGLLLLPAALGAAAMRFRSAQSRFLLAMLVLIAAIWMGLTHLQSRFFVLAIPICAMLIAQAKWHKSVMAVLCCVLLALQFFPRAVDGGDFRIESVEARLDRFLDIDRRLVDEAGFGILGRMSLMGFVQPDGITSQTRLDLVGGVQPFLYQLPMTRLSYRTVFDVDSSGADKSVIADWLAGQDAPQADRLVVIDPAELDRLSRTYYGIPKLTEEEMQLWSSRPDVYVIRPPR